VARICYKEYMSSVNYNLLDQRNAYLAALSTNTTLTANQNLVLGPITTSGFQAIVIDGQSASLSVDVYAMFSNDNITYPTSVMATFLSGGTNLNKQFVFPVTGTWVKVQFSNRTASLIAIVMTTYGSQSPAFDFRTQFDPVSLGDTMLLSKSLLTGSLSGTGNYNVDLRALGSLQVGLYDASLRQQVTPIKWSASFPTDPNTCNIAKYGSTITVTPGANKQTNIVTTNDTYFETNRGSPYGSVNDTFVLRFNAAFPSATGSAYMLFGDQYVGVGVSAGVFGIKYYSGAGPQVYSQLFDKTLTGSATESFVFGPTTVPTMNITEVTAGQAANLVFLSDSTFTCGFLGDRVLFKRTGAATSTSAATRTGADVFYTGQPTLIAGSFRSTDIFVPSTSFSTDRMDGSSTLPNMPPANGIAGELIFTADGLMMLMIVDPRNGTLRMVDRRNTGVRLFSGFTSKLSMRVNTCSITYSDLNLFTYREPMPRSRFDNVLTLSTYWPNFIGAPGTRYIYLANITATRANTYITAINVRLQQGVDASVYLLTNTSMVPTVTGQNASNEYATISQASDGTYVVNNETYLISQTGITDYQKFTDAVIAKKMSTGSLVTFVGGDDFMADLFDPITVAVKINTGMGTIKYTISVEYTY